MDCDQSWLTHEGSWHCFKAYSSQVSFPEAKRECIAKNANLVSIFGDSSNRYAQRLVARKNVNFRTVIFLFKYSKAMIRLSAQKSTLYLNEKVV